MSGRISLIAAAVLCAAVMAATPATGEESHRLPALPVTSEWPSWPYRTSCGSLSFDPNAVFSEVPEAGLSSSALDRALRRELKLIGIKTAKHGWRLARRLSDRAAFVRGQPGAELESGHELEHIELAHRNGHWRMESYGQKCWLWTMRKGRYADTWVLAPNQPPLGPDTRTIRIVTGAHCSRKEKPPVIVGKPRFDRFGTKLAMTVWLRHRGAGGNELCAYGLPPFPPIKVELPEPLGDRELFDGGEYPPRPATVYEEPTAIGL